jgi:hypothetical protein
VDRLAILRRGPLGNPPFAPVYQRLAKSMGQQRNLAALATVAIIVAIVILPLITASLVQEASCLYERFRSKARCYRMKSWTLMGLRLTPAISYAYIASHAWRFPSPHSQTAS